MSTPGQQKALDSSKQDTVSYLVAAGVSIRQAARYVDCDPKSIRREAARNDDFRARLAKAKSEASIRPIQTLQQAAQENWRAALSWMERVEPDRFARPDASLVTKREANQFVAELIEAIEKAVKKTRERKHLFKLLAPAMPNAMRRNWEVNARRRAAEQATQVFDKKKEKREQRKYIERMDRNARRRTLWREIGNWLPVELYRKLEQDLDLFDPEEVFAQTPDPAPSAGGADSDNRTPDDLIKDAFADVPRNYKLGSMGAMKKYNPEIRGTAQRYSWSEWCALPLEERIRQSNLGEKDDPSPAAASPDDTTKGASLITNDASLATSDFPPPGRLPDNSAPPPSANPKPFNDLPTAGEAKSDEQRPTTIRKKIGEAESAGGAHCMGRRNNYE